ncbi:MAG: hydroxymethylglutaryl-CoA lyase [Streptosporangiales bacterium]|nr:hydroxymethylglutaryl-CoA lyase [Streptosporangiales bacterium]
MNVDRVELHEVGPREGFQFEGIGQPDKISTAQKVELVEALAQTGLRKIQVTSFVSPKHVPQMADADDVSTQVRSFPGVAYDAVYLNDKGLERAIAAGIYEIDGHVSLTASETFSKQNQRRDMAADIEMQRKQLTLYRDHGIPVRSGTLMAAFGCNYEGDISVERVLECVGIMHDLAAEFDTQIDDALLADTMGWADPDQIKRVIGAVRERWPAMSVSLHLHDTRGTGIANVYAALETGVTAFDSSVGGLGGCPFAKTVAGNVATEDIVFMCERMGIETGVDLGRLVEVVKLAEEIVGHPLPGKLGHVYAAA